MLAKKYFSGFASGNESEFDRPKIEKDRKVDIFQKDFKQSKFAISFRGYPMATVKIVRASLLAKILGSGFSSRLYESLRTKKHLVYSIHTGVVGFPDAGYFYVDSGTGEDKLQEAISEVFNEVNKLLRNGISDSELKKAKNILLYNFLSGIEEIDSYAYMLSTQWLFKERIKGVAEKIKEIKSITKKEVMETANYIFSDKPKVNVLTKSLKSFEINF